MNHLDSPGQNKTFNQHLQATLVLGLPLVGAHLAQMLIGVTDTIMLGWLGTEELAAGTLAAQSYFIFLIMGLGIGAGMTPLISNALGRNDPVSVRRITRMGLWVLIGLAILFLIPLSFTREILIILRQEADLAQLAQDYMRIAQWSLIPAFVLIGLRSFLTAIEYAKFILNITILAALINGLLNYSLIFGHFGAPALGIEGAAWATTITNLLAAGVTLIYVYRCEAAKPYTLFVRPWRSDWEAMGKVIKLGFPISLSILAEAGMFTATSIMIGWLGAVPLAAHGIAMQLASVTFMVPLGFAQAASVRVSNAVGRADEPSIGQAAYAVMVLGVGFALISALAFLLIPELLINLFIDDSNPDASTIIAYAVPLLVMAAAFQVFDAMQVASSGSLRGLHDTKVPMIIATISYWVIGVGSAYILGILLDYGGAGIWAGLVIGLTAAAACLTRRFIKREKLGLVQLT